MPNYARCFTVKCTLLRYAFNLTTLVLLWLVVGACDSGIFSQPAYRFLVPDVPRGLSFLGKSIDWRVSGTVIDAQMAKAGDKIPLTKPFHAEGDFILAEPILDSAEYIDQIGATSLICYGWVSGGNLEAATIYDGLAAKILSAIDKAGGCRSGLNMGKLRQIVHNNGLGTDIIDAQELALLIMDHSLTIYDFKKPEETRGNLKIPKGVWMDGRGKIVCTNINDGASLAVSFVGNHATWFNADNGSIYEIYAVTGLRSTPNLEGFLHEKRPVQ